MRDGSPRPCPAPGSPPGGTEPRSPPETSTPPCASETGGPPPGASKRQTPEGTRGVGGLRSFTSGRMSWGHGGNQPSPVVGEAKVRVPVLPLAPPPLGVAGDGHHTSPEASQTRARQRVGEAPDRDGAQRQEPALRLSGQGGAATRPPKCTSRVSWEGGRPVAPRGARRPLSRLGRHAGREGFPPGKLRLCGAEVRSPSRGGPRCQRQGQEPPSPGNRPGSWGGWGGTTGALLSHLQAGDHVMPGGGGSGSSRPTADVEGHPPSLPTRPRAPASRLCCLSGPRGDVCPGPALPLSPPLGHRAVQPLATTTRLLPRPPAHANARSHSRAHTHTPHAPTCAHSHVHHVHPCTHHTHSYRLTRALTPTVPHTHT